MNHAIAQMFTKQGQKPDPIEEKESAASEAGETAQDESAENGGMSDVEAQHHSQVQNHMGKALSAHARGKHKEVKVHLKLAQHHHAAAMTEAGHDLNDQENINADSGDNDQNEHDSGGSPEQTEGMPASTSGAVGKGSSKGSK